MMAYIIPIAMGMALVVVTRMEMRRGRAYSMPISLREAPVAFWLFVIFRFLFMVGFTCWVAWKITHFTPVT